MQTRKDSKGRKLWTGESQEKDGRYRYKYVDSLGKRKSVYSWKLTPSDAVPKGKRQDISLREKEKLIQRDLDDGIATNGGDIILLDLVQKYVDQKQNMKPNTLQNYRSTLNTLKKYNIGTKKIKNIKPSDVKSWIISLQKDGKSYGTINILKSVVKPAFQMAVNDDYIRKNPFDFSLNAVIVNDSKTREAITERQEHDFLSFIKNDKYYQRYYDAIYILFHTGMRISEFCGLTIRDIDFENMRINVDHQLQYVKNEGYKITGTKTKNGTRYIPMSNDVAECFKRILKKRNIKIEPIVDGVTGFLFLSSKNNVIDKYHWEKYFRNICRKYNQAHKEPLSITPHICRHTFCSNMAKAGMNPKSLQYIMGHSDISMTLNFYTHIQFEDAQKEMQKIILMN